MSEATARPVWQELLAPLPADAMPRRSPVATDEVLATPHGAAIAGWEQLVVELSAGPAGMRVLHVVLDARGRAISASDMVFYRITSAADRRDTHEPARIRFESIGGRIEVDGLFNGTCWTSDGFESEEDEDPRLDSRSSSPTAAQAEALMKLVADVMRRSLV